MSDSYSMMVDSFRAALSAPIDGADFTFRQPYPCDACGRPAETHELVRTPGGAGSVHRGCLSRWASIVSA